MILILLLKCFKVYVCFFVYGYVHMSTSASGDNKRAIDPSANCQLPNFDRIWTMVLGKRIKNS